MAQTGAGASSLRLPEVLPRLLRGDSLGEEEAERVIEIVMRDLFDNTERIWRYVFTKQKLERPPHTRR